MRRSTRFTLAALLAAFTAPLPAQTPAPAPATRAIVETLASEKLGGREAGSAGERAAGDYLASQLARLGARPLPGRRDMFHSFPFTAGSRDGGSTVTVRAGGGKGTTFANARQVQALSFSDDGSVSGPVVFAGYGIVV